MATKNIMGRPQGSTAPKSDAVKKVREAMKLSQEKFARELDCTSSTVYKMETDERLPGKGKILKRLKELAKKHGIEIESE